MGTKKYIKIRLISEKKDINTEAYNSNLPSNSTDVYPGFMKRLIP